MRFGSKQHCSKQQDTAPALHFLRTSPEKSLTPSILSPNNFCGSSRRQHVHGQWYRFHHRCITFFFSFWHRGSSPSAAHRSTPKMLLQRGVRGSISFLSLLLV